MPSTALKIIPTISNYEDHAVLTSDSAFAKKYLAIFEPLNTKFTLCEIVQQGVHETRFNYIPGYSFIEISIVLKLVGDILIDYQGDINLAWKAGVQIISEDIKTHLSRANVVDAEAVVSVALKVLVNNYLSGKTINSEIITDKKNSFKRVRVDLENIKKALPARKVYLFFHPNMVAKVDDMLQKIITADENYKRATSTVLIYNQELSSFLADETLADYKYDTIKEAVSILDTFRREKDPSIDYNSCLGVLYRADNLIDEYYGNKDTEYVEPDFPI